VALSDKEAKSRSSYADSGFLMHLLNQKRLRKRLTGAVRNATISLLLLFLWMALDTGSWDLAIFCPVFLLKNLVTSSAIVMIGKFQIEFLLILGQLLFAFDCGFTMAFHAFLDLVPLFPGVFPVFVYVMAIGALCSVFLGVLVVGKGYRAFGVLGPERGLQGDYIGRLGLSGAPAQAQKNYATHEGHYR